MSDTLTALDATFLELEQLDEGALMSIGGVSVFDPVPGGGAPSIEEVCANLGARLDQLPRYSQRLSSVRTGGFGWPRWTDDDRFCISDHISHVALPAPGGQAELCEWAADFYSHRLDRTRPLWEMALIEGLAEGRWALAHKTHHCLVDGVGSVDVAYVLLDTEPNPPERPPAPLPAARQQLGPAAVRAEPAAADRERGTGRRPRRAGRCARGPAPTRGPRAIGRGHRADRSRRADRRAAHLTQRADRIDEAVRGRQSPARGLQGNPPGARRVDQRRRARGVHHRPAPPASRRAANSSNGAACARWSR